MPLDRGLLGRSVPRRSSRVSRPTEVVGFLQRRVMRWESTDETTDYRPLPFTWNHELRVRETADLLSTLRHIRDWIAEGAESWKRQHAGPDLYAAVAGRFEADALRVIEEAVASGDSAQLTAGSLDPPRGASVSRLRECGLRATTACPRSSGGRRARTTHWRSVIGCGLKRYSRGDPRTAVR